MHFKLSLLFGFVLLTEFLVLYQGSNLPGDRLSLAMIIGVSETIGVIFSECLKNQSDHSVMQIGTFLIITLAYVISSGHYNDYI